MCVMFSHLGATHPKLEINTNIKTNYKKSGQQTKGEAKTKSVT